MAEEFADHRQTLARGDGRGREGVAQVVDADVLQPRTSADALPERLKITQPLARQGAGDDGQLPKRGKDETVEVPAILLRRARLDEDRDVFPVEPFRQFLHRDRLAAGVPLGGGILAIARCGDDSHGAAARLLAGQDRAGPEADPARPASGAVLDHVALAPARQHPQPEARDLAVPDEVFGGPGLRGIDKALGELGHGPSVFEFRPLYSAKSSGIVNEHIDIAKEKGSSSQFCMVGSALWFGEGAVGANQNAGSDRSTTLLPSSKRNGIVMASKTTLNAKNLEALGTERLAQLLIEVSTGNAAAKRRLRLELAGARSPLEAGRAIAKRLTSIANAKSAITWKKRKAFIEDLQTQRRGIIEQVGPHDPEQALFLMWRFMGLANPVIERCQSGDDEVIEVFHEACGDFGPLVEAAKPSAEMLIDTTFDALCENTYSQYDKLISTLSPTLGAKGLERLRQRLEGFLEQIGVTAITADRIGRQTTAEYMQSISERRKRRMAQSALLELADVQGDVDAFIAQLEPWTRTIPSHAIDIASRLVAADRAAEALDFLDAADVDQDDWDRMDWQDARIDVLEAMGQKDEAQAFRWTCFERDLWADYLRAYLRKLPDFDDIEAEEKAIAIAMADPDLLAALQFFLDWQSPDRASGVLIERHKEIDGNHFEYLTPAADALAESHPLAATLVLRAMIEFAVSKGRSKRYRHAARHLATCAELAPRIEDFGAFDTHDTYVASLKDQHGRKSGFWGHVT